VTTSSLKIVISTRDQGRMRIRGDEGTIQSSWFGLDAEAMKESAQEHGKSDSCEQVSFQIVLEKSQMH
jgi:hypothetical protein